MRLQGKRILVADDEKRLSALLATYLESQGASVEVAGNGQEAFRLATLHTPDLIVMDLNMPGMNGLEAIRSLRMTSVDMPILVLTGYTTPETFAAAREAGATEVMAKPPSLQNLLDRIAALIDERGAAGR